jgi:hypothetical protein
MNNNKCSWSGFRDIVGPWLLGAGLLASLTSCNSQYHQGEAVLQARGVDYAVVDEIPGLPNADAAHRQKDGMILITKNCDKYLAFHELAHQVRHEAGLWTNHQLEERIAVRVGLTMSGSRASLKKMDKLTAKANRFEARELTASENALIEKEVEKTLRLLTK